MNRIFTFLIAVFLAALLYAPAQAVPNAGKDVIDRLAAAGSDRYPDANVVVVESRRQVRYNENGTYLDRSYELVRILTDAGKRGYGEQAFEYARKYDAVRIEYARVIKPDGRMVEVPADMIKDVTHPALAQMNIYDADTRMQMVTFPNLEVGDAIEYEVLDSCFQAPMEGQFDLIELFQGGEPIIHKRVEIDGPDTNPVKYLFKDGQADFTTASRDGRTTWSWEVRDVSRIVAEPAMPSYLSFAPRLEASTIDSWADISRWWYEMTQPFRNRDENLVNTVKEVTKGLSSDEEKIRAVYHFVAQKVRYMGLGTGKKAGFEPKPATETLATRYGVCRDVAVLMSSMLDVLEIPSSVVLTRAGELIDTEVPTIGFNHAIVALPRADGGWRFCDPTVENNPELLLSMEGDAHMLVCTPGGENLYESDHSPATENMGTISAASRVDATGRLVSEVAISTVGIYDFAFRSFIKRSPPRELESFWQRVVTGVHPGARLIGFSTSDPEDLDTPFGLRFSYEVADYAVQAGDYLLIKAPVSTNGFELILQSFLAAAGLPERTYPFDLGVTLGSTQQESLTLPPGYQVKSLPERVELEAGKLEYKMGYTSFQPSEARPELRVDYSKQVLIDAKQLDTGQYLELKKILRASSRSGRGEIILVRAQSGR